MREPGATHPIRIVAHPGRVRVFANGTQVAATTQALRLTEAGYEPVLYLPPEDVDARSLRENPRRTYCPFKGEAHYLDLVIDGHVGSAALWSYANPYPAVVAIRRRLAFDRAGIVIVED